MTDVELTTIGNSPGVVIRKQVWKRLRVQKRDPLALRETPDGIELTPADPEVARRLGEAERVMRQNRDVLRRLTKVSFSTIGDGPPVENR